MPRPIWKGAISFGLVTIPVNLYSAIEGRETLAFHLLHKKDGSRIEQKRFCKEEGVEVPWSEVVKGYEYAKGQYIVVEDEEIDKIKIESTHTIEIDSFVPRTEIDDRYLDSPYYISPTD